MSEDVNVICSVVFVLTCHVNAPGDSHIALSRGTFEFTRDFCLVMHALCSIQDTHKLLS